MSRILIRGGTVLTLGTKSANLSQADLLIDEDRIAEIGSGLRARDAEVIDAGESIIMPGFVDAHRHAWRGVFRNSGDPAKAETLASRMAPDDVYAATLITLLSAAESGTTALVDWFDVPGGPEHLDAALQAHTDAGLRTVLVLSGSVATDTELQRAIDRSGSLTSIAAGPTDISSGAETGTAWETARSMGLRIHAHAGLDRADAGSIAAAGETLGSDVTLIHCTHAGASDLDAVSTSQASIIMTPSSEMARGIGSPPVQALIDRGIRPGLGVDDDLLGPGDMLAQLRSVISMQHATYFDLKLAGKAGLPNLLTTREVIRYGTLDGAKAVGLGDVTGSLEVGKQADVIVLRADTPNIFPVNDPIGAVVWGMDTSNVEWVIVGGTPLMRAGELVADVAAVRDLAISAKDRIMEGVESEVAR